MMGEQRQQLVDNIFKQSSTYLMDKFEHNNDNLDSNIGEEIS
jgi:hypothetical protein